MRPADCTNPLFQPPDELFGTAPWDQSAFIYDGVAALALAIDGARAAVDSGDEGSGVNGQLIFKKLLEVRMAGASGAFALDAQGDRGSYFRHPSPSVSSGPTIRFRPHVRPWLSIPALM